MSGLNLHLPETIEVIENTGLFFFSHRGYGGLGLNHNVRCFSPPGGPLQRLRDQGGHFL